VERGGEQYNGRRECVCWRGSDSDFATPHKHARSLEVDRWRALRGHGDGGIEGGWEGGEGGGGRVDKRKAGKEGAF
jgi:hypothetical protein